MGGHLTWPRSGVVFPAAVRQHPDLRLPAGRREKGCGQNDELRIQFGLNHFFFPSPSGDRNTPRTYARKRCFSQCHRFKVEARLKTKTEPLDKINSFQQRDSSKKNLPFIVGICVSPPVDEIKDPQEALTCWE